MADSSSAPSSSGSYTDADMRDLAEWQMEVMKSFNVQELDELLREKGKSVKGHKPQKAMEVAWCYTKEEIAEWRRNRQTTEPPAVMVKRGSQKRTMSGQGTLDDFMRRCRHEYIREPTTGPRDNGEYTERCRLCGDIK